jgi:hypothetical protein
MAVVDTPRFYVWTHGMSRSEVTKGLKRFPGLGAVLNRSNYWGAESLDIPPIAIVNNSSQAESLREVLLYEVPFTAAIVNDERNADGPSGGYMPPEEYGKLFQRVRKILKGLIPVYTMGLQPVGNWLETLLQRRRFDDEYHNRLPLAEGRAFNPNKVRPREIDRVRRLPGPWIFSPAPFRTWWDRLWEPVSVQDWARISMLDNVTGIAFWTLTETAGGPWFGNRPQTEHGLLDPNGVVTNVGLDVLRALEG